MTKDQTGDKRGGRKGGRHSVSIYNVEANYCDGGYVTGQITTSYLP